MTNDLIIGYGEVGQALAKIIKTKNIIDTGKKLGFVGNCDVLHICIPYSENFVSIVKKAILDHKPKITIIHSTVQVGTTKKIGKNVCYSFVRGMHPKLENMVNHGKHIGCQNENILFKASKHLQKYGFKTFLHPNSEVVELGKLFDTAYYGVCIAFTKFEKEITDKMKLDFEDIENMNKTYNYGYFQEGKEKFIRPELEPTPGPIGGHCVVSNAKILREKFKSKLLDAIIESK